LFLSAKHLLFAAIRLMALFKIADLIALVPRRAKKGAKTTLGALMGKIARLSRLGAEQYRGAHGSIWAPLAEGSNILARSNKPGLK
jgi:hypothetical protein